MPDEVVEHPHTRLKANPPNWSDDWHAMQRPFGHDPLAKLPVAHLGNRDVLGAMPVVTRYDYVDAVQVFDRNLRLRHFLPLPHLAEASIPSRGRTIGGVEW